MQRHRQGRQSNSLAEGSLKRSGDPLNEAARSGENHQHLNQFLKEQIQSRKGGRSVGKPGSAMSERSTKMSNALIDFASQTNNRRPSSKQITNKMVQMSNYQADPMAATMAATRSLGLSKLNVSKFDIELDKELFNRTVKGGVGRGFEGSLAIDA